jgi:hypothetical protein
LSGWATFGLVLEAMHGFKVAGYLDDAWTRELLTLAHAHGVGLAILVDVGPIVVVVEPDFERHPKMPEPLLLLQIIAREPKFARREGSEVRGSVDWRQYNVV